MSAATAHAPEISTGHDVVVGIDTHKLTHMAVALGANGGWLGSLKLDAKRSGDQELIRWAAAFGSNPVFAVEREPVATAPGSAAPCRPQG
jgi:transposase